MFKIINKWLGREKEPPLSPEEAQRLRALFKERYRLFRVLLTENSRALELMAEMESALTGQKLFGMSFIRSRATAAIVAVYRMVQSMTSLGPGRYDALIGRHQAIQDKLEEILAAPKEPGGDRFILNLGELDRDMVDLVGGKMANLGEAANRLGLAAPPGFAVTAQAYRYFLKSNNLQDEINRRIQATNLERPDHLFALSSRLQQIIVAAPLPPDLATGIESAYRKLEAEAEPGIRVSLRSSAVGEDAAHMSFAGQYRTQLNVHPDSILDAYKEIAASKYSPQAMLYRYSRGLRDEDLPMCVGCLAMVKARAGGVIYTANPLDPADGRVIVSSIWGLPRGVVDGEAETDRFIVQGEPGSMEVVESSIAHKPSRLDCSAEEGVCRLASTGPEADLESLSTAQAIELAEAARRIEEHYASPQDVEFAVNEQGLPVFLQCRPLSLHEFQDAGRAEEAARPGALIQGGLVVSRGAAAGPVYWVRKEADLLGFVPGSVLVVDQPWPRWAALLSGAKAVLARRGSLAGHLATVAREYGVPALFGLGDEVEKLEPGNWVTVDAVNGVVFEGRVKELLKEGPAPLSLLDGSPVQKSLKLALSHIAPLNLLDPNSTDFRPESCRTLHDITRFCHEKSVHEMFSFGRDHHFGERAGRQLFFKVPMQYWVVNLDDGLNDQTGEKYVHLSDIACEPMLALWQGLVAIPWDGPPALDGKGFASVLFHSTKNPALGSPMKTPRMDKNYFMISKNFMNLQSRFGYHFCTVEALLDDHQPASYISFSFSGGAADDARRAARAVFIADILEPRGYDAEVLKDTLRARLEGAGRERMLNELKVLGYLLMHTRQLDMIMTRRGSVEAYRVKILKDIDKVLASDPDNAA